MASNINSLVNDVVGMIEECYDKHADFIVSCMLANIGVYNIVKNNTADAHDFTLYEETFCDIYTSYIWRDISILSPMLRRSMVHTIITSAKPYIYIMDDKKLSKAMLNFKTDITVLMKRHAKLLAYSDVEGTEFFTLVNASYAYPQGEYESNSKQASNQIRRVYLKHKNKVPNVMMLVLDDMQDVINIRHITQGSLCRPTDFTNFPQFPKYEKDKFNENILKFAHTTVREMVSPLIKIYRHLIPFYALSSLQPLISIQGEKDIDDVSIGEKLNMDALDGVRLLKSFLHTPSVSLIKKHFQHMPIFEQSFDIIEDYVLFDKCSFEPFGSLALHVFKLINDFYQKNVRLMVMSDLLCSGIYNAVSQEHQVDVELVAKLIVACEYDFDMLYDELSYHSILDDITRHMIDNIDIALKRVKRYERYLRFIEDREQAHDYIDLIFGDVHDQDGSPHMCAICLDDAQEKKDGWFMLPCKHKFHIECVDNLLYSCGEVAKCPLCRVDIN
jgi:hypothetical protein